METGKSITLGYYILPHLRSELLQNGTLSYDKIIKYLSRKRDPNGCILLLLKQYLERKFGTVSIFIDFEKSGYFPNGTKSGLLQKVSHSEVDIGARPVHMDGNLLKAVDFTYPYKMNDYTFITHKPEYSPKIFGIFQCFTLSVWFTMAFIFIITAFACYFIFKKYKFSKVLLNIFAILLRQDVQVHSSSFVEKLIIYSWVFGAMILCLSYDSVFLSFLSIPPLSKIKHLSDLALAVQDGYYHCINSPRDGIVEYLLDADEENLKIIAKDMLQNNVRFSQLFIHFVTGKKSTNLAYFLNTRLLESFAGKFYVSEDRFFESLLAMMVSRDFCYKGLIDQFVHRMMASGIYFKIMNNFNFLMSFYFSGIQEKETSNRKFTLIDVAPAFIFLLCGYFIFFLVFIGEILIARKNLRNSKRNKKQRITKLFIQNPV